MSARSCEPNFKVDAVGTCGCGCGAVGSYRVKPWRDGTRCVRRTCTCARCRGGRNRRGGRDSQARAVRALGLPVSSLRPGHEELMPGLAVRWEHKSGAQSKPVVTRYLASRTQSEAARARGDTRPFVATFADGRRQVAVIDLDDLPAVLVAFIEMGLAS